MQNINFIDYSKIENLRKVLESKEYYDLLLKTCSQEDVLRFKNFLDVLEKDFEVIKKVDARITELNSQDNKIELLEKVKSQFKDAVEWVLDSGDFNELLKTSNSKPYVIEVNGDELSTYSGEPIEFVRIETDNLLVYVNGDYTISDMVTIMDDDCNNLGDFKLNIDKRRNN